MEWNGMFQEVQQQGDIMGDIREEVQSFYMRDYVEEKVETRLVEHLSLSDLVFSRNKRVKDVRWHPQFSHIVSGVLRLVLVIRKKGHNQG